MKVQDVMIRLVRTCSRRDSLKTAARRMWDNDIGFLPVVDAERRVVGVVTDRDLLMGAYTHGGLSEAVIDSVMAREVVTCGPNDEVAQVERLMQQRQIRRVPVIDASGEIVGVVTLGDLARSTPFNPVKKALTGLAISRTLAAICRPRAALARAAG